MKTTTYILGAMVLGLFLSIAVGVATLVVYNTMRLQIIVRAHHRIGIDFYGRGVFAHGGYARFFYILTQQNFITNAVGYLQIDGFGFSKIHNYQRCIISDSLKRQ